MQATEPLSIHLQGVGNITNTQKHPPEPAG